MLTVSFSLPAVDVSCFRFLFKWMESTSVEDLLSVLIMS